MRILVACLGLVACRAGGAADPDAPAADGSAPDAPAPDAVAIDAPPAGVPDFAPVPYEIMGTAQITTTYFGPDACEVVEGCVGAAGNRRLLRFTAVTENAGTGAFVVGLPPPPGQSNDVFVWSPCHQHHHVPGFEDYALVGAAGAVVTGHKQAYCLRDDERERPGAPGGGFGCANQGISAGWADVYGSDLPCQWIDVTDVTPGAYTLRITVNPDRRFVESDYGNDTFELPVLL